MGYKGTMGDQVTLELIRTVGEAFKNIVIRIEQIEKNLPSKDASHYLDEQIKKIKENQQKLDEILDALAHPETGIIEAVRRIECQVEADSRIIMHWDRLWEKIFRAQSVGKYVGIVLLSLVGLAFLIVESHKILQFIASLFNGGSL